METRDFMFFQHKEVNNFMNKSENKDLQEDEGKSSESVISAKVKSSNPIKDLMTLSNFNNPFRPKSKLSSNLFFLILQQLFL